MQDYISTILNSPSALKRLIFMLGVLVVVVFVRSFFLNVIGKQKSLDASEKRHYFVASRYITVFIYGLIVYLFWVEEIKTVALSTLALGAAFVLFFQDIIKCFIGSIYLFFNKPFQIGDIIQVNDHRGEVSDQSLLTTTLWELALGKDVRLFTGKKLVIPNSYFVIFPTYNENTRANFTFYTYQLPLYEGDNWVLCRNEVLKEADALTLEYREDAVRFWKKYSDKFGYKMPDLTPKVYFHVGTDQKAWLYLRICCPETDCSEVRYQIHKSYFEKRHRGDFK